MTKTCLGCGIILQNAKKENPGYVKELSMDYCMRCFRINHYRDFTNEKVTVNPRDVLEKINSQKGYAFFFIDFINLHKEAIRYFKKIKLPKTLIISKMDTIPKSIYLEKIKKWLKESYQIEEPILFLQKEKITSEKKLIEKIDAISEKNLYFIGLTNAGKSTMINSLFEKEKITVSEMPNTTLDFIKLKRNEKIIFDTPGLSYDMETLDESMRKKANIEHEIHPRTYLLKEEAFLNIESKYEISFSCENSVTFFGSDKLELKKAYKPIEKEEVEIKVLENTNLYWKGIGFFYIKKACTVTLRGIKREHIEIEKSFFQKEK